MRHLNSVTPNNRPHKTPARTSPEEKEAQRAIYHEEKVKEETASAEAVAVEADKIRISERRDSLFDESKDDKDMAMDKVLIAFEEMEKKLVALATANVCTNTHTHTHTHTVTQSHTHTHTQSHSHVAHQRHEPAATRTSSGCIR